jgi:hypothetical protein
VDVLVGVDVVVRVADVVGRGVLVELEVVGGVELEVGSGAGSSPPQPASVTNTETTTAAAPRPRQD